MLLLFAFCSPCCFLPFVRQFAGFFDRRVLGPPFAFIFLWLSGSQARQPSTFAMPPRRTRNSFESSLPVVSSSCATSTVTSSSTAASAPAQVSGSSASASISPEFLASVIQAIQTPISVIVQQSLSAAVGAPSVSTQGLPAISVQGLSESSLVNRAAHLDAFGMHQPWSSTITIDCCWVPASECFDHVHFSASGFAVKRCARYVLVSCCSTFCLCVFLRWFAVLSTLFVHGLHPTHYSQFGLCFAPNCKSYCSSFVGSLAPSATVRGRPRLLASSVQGCLPNHCRKICKAHRLVCNGRPAIQLPYSWRSSSYSPSFSQSSHLPGRGLW